MKGYMQRLADVMSTQDAREYTEKTVNTGSTSQELLPANPKRTLLLIENRASNDARISFGGTADESTLTLASGERLTLNTPAPTNQINALVKSSPGDLYVVEG